MNGNHEFRTSLPLSAAEQSNLKDEIKKTSIEHVARACGLSAQCVTRVVAGNNCRLKTRKKVRLHLADVEREQLASTDQALAQPTGQMLLEVSGSEEQLKSFHEVVVTLAKSMKITLETA